MRSLGGALSRGTGALRRVQRDGQGVHARRKCHMRTERGGGHLRAQKTGLRGPQSDTLISDFRPPELKTLISVAQAAWLTVAWLGRWSRAGRQVCAVRKGRVHTDPHTEALHRQAESPSSEVKGALSLIFDPRLAPSNTRPTRTQASSPSGPGPPTSRVCLSNQPPLLQRTSQSHLSGALFP